MKAAPSRRKLVPARAAPTRSISAAAKARRSSAIRKFAGISVKPRQESGVAAAGAPSCIASIVLSCTPVPARLARAKVRQESRNSRASGTRPTSFTCSGTGGMSAGRRPATAISKSRGSSGQTSRRNQSSPVKFGTQVQVPTRPISWAAATGWMLKGSTSAPETSGSTADFPAISGPSVARSSSAKVQTKRASCQSRRSIFSSRCASRANSARISGLRA